ncbi:hypothetical protein FF38_09488 [Lucilia cuprina]|uniref:Uncharacterized protein n=1 Tax=Lucilia cuprina TaxID=7375 RepID=A0A0L0C8A6_LUCCU|nr:hypothetical protein FF38_09488 [Lucilia cuprina]
MVPMSDINLANANIRQGNKPNNPANDSTNLGDADYTNAEEDKSQIEPPTFAQFNEPSTPTKGNRRSEDDSDSAQDSEFDSDGEFVPLPPPTTLLGNTSISSPAPNNFIGSRVTLRSDGSVKYPSDIDHRTKSIIYYLKLVRTQVIPRKDVDIQNFPYYSALDGSFGRSNKHHHGVGPLLDALVHQLGLNQLGGYEFEDYAPFIDPTLYGYLNRLHNFVMSRTTTADWSTLTDRLPDGAASCFIPLCQRAVEVRYQPATLSSFWTWPTDLSVRTTKQHLQAYKDSFLQKFHAAVPPGLRSNFGGATLNYLFISGMMKHYSIQVEQSLQLPVMAAHCGEFSQFYTYITDNCSQLVPARYTDSSSNPGRNNGSGSNSNTNNNNNRNNGNNHNGKNQSNKNRNNKSNSNRGSSNDSSRGKQSPPDPNSST